MPMIDLTVPKGVLTPERTDHLIKELSRIIIHWEGAEYSSLYRYATRMYIHEAAGVAVAMKLHDPSKRPYYRLIVSVPPGTSCGHWAGLLAALFVATSGALAMWAGRPALPWSRYPAFR